ncbi:hypothetical protein Pint_16652 [Pistacia integerrima]|uniref:Uncharacterized protein n=1 Tax=Pistacia integerrima TaxID=434235 RepID=A0ACC0ZDG2_9ROSI|nr:hypothetical protein Pint_16652 [Pistacia integerrima]
MVTTTGLDLRLFRSSIFSCSTISNPSPSRHRRFNKGNRCLLIQA